MSPRQISKSIIYSLIASMAVSVAAIAADTAPAGAPEPTREMRAKMATIHEQMAACLRSDKSMSDCRSEMMSGCQKLMGDSGCHVMGMGKHNYMMKTPTPNTAVPKDQ
jgi:hypothetical protein